MDIQGAPGTTTSAPGPLRVAAAIVVAEALAALVASVVFVVVAVSGHASDAAVAATLAGLLAVLGLGMGAVARGLLRARPRAQTPAYLIQFFALVVAYYQRHTLIAVTIVLAIVAVAAVAALSAPESRTALRRE